MDDAALLDVVVPYDRAAREEISMTKARRPRRDRVVRTSRLSTAEKMNL